MKYSFKYHHLIYVAAFGLLGLTLTSTVYMADPSLPANESNIAIEHVENMTDTHYLHVVDVDPMRAENPAYSRVGNTLRADWALETGDELATLSYSIDEGSTWTEIVHESSTTSLTLFQVPETDAKIMLVKVDTSDTTLTSEIELHIEPIVEPASERPNKRNR